MLQSTDAIVKDRIAITDGDFTFRAILLKDDGWDQDFLDKHRVESIYTLYVYDPALLVHVCSLTPGAFLVPVYPVVVTPSDMTEVGEEVYDAVYEAWAYATEPASLFHLSFLSKVETLDDAPTSGCLNIRQCQWSEEVTLRKGDNWEVEALISLTANHIF